MIPFVAAGGLLIALGFLLAGYDVASLYEKISISDYSLWNLPGNEFVHEIKNSAGDVIGTETITVSQSGLLLYIGWTLFLLGQAAMSFLVPALAGYISFGLAGRPGIAPGFVMGVVAVQVGAGFIGGLVGGILAGYFAAWLAGLSVPAWLRGLMPVVIIPLGTTLVVGAVMYLVLGRPLAALMTGLKDLKRIQPAKGSTPETAKFVETLPQQLYKAMNDDMMTPIVISLLFEACHQVNLLVDRKAKISADDLEKLSQTMHLFTEDILGLSNATQASDASREESFGKVVDMVLDMRAKAREAKDWATTDQIRDALNEAGFIIKDTPDGTVWEL